MKLDTLTLKLGELFLNDIPLTKENLLSSGLSINDLIRLQDKAIIKKDGDIYQISNFDFLYMYGLLLSHNKDAKCKSFWEKCYALNSHHFKIAIQLFWYYLNFNEYDKALEILSNLLLKEDVKQTYLVDLKMYLYLLSFLTTIPENLLPILRNITFESLLPLKEDKRFQGNSYEYYVREHIFKQKFFKARIIIEKSETKIFEKNKNKIPFNIIIERFLIDKCIRVRKNSKTDLWNYLKDEDYASIIMALESKKRTETILPNEKYILAICKTIINLDENGIIPVSLNLMPAENFTEAINDCEYERALKFHNQGIRAKGFEEKRSFLGVILGNLVDRIKMARATNNDPKYILLDYLQNGNIKEFLKLLRKILRENNKEEYENLLIYLLKLGAYKGTAYKFYIAYKQILNGTFVFDVDGYLKSFYEKNNANLKEEAKIYLDILKEAPRFTNCSLNLASLESALLTNETLEHFNPLDHELDIVGLVTNGVEIDTIIEENMVDTEGTLLIYLILAKYYYSLGFKKMGDKYLDRVNKSIIVKTKLVKNVLDIILKNKNLYLSKAKTGDSKRVLLKSLLA